MYKLAIVGLGKMGISILIGMMNSSLYVKDEVLLVVHRKEQQDILINEGYHVTLDIKEAYDKSEIILLAIKPQKFMEVLADSKTYDFANRCVISIAAGVTIDELNNYFNNAFIVRGMPNTSATISQSVTTVCTKDKNNKFYLEALNIFKAIGSIVEIEENEMDYTLPLNGSMPAYIYYFIKAFIDAACNNGVDKEKAKQLIIDTIISSCNMLKTTDEDLSILIDNVCSKGGTTIAGLNKLKNANVDYSIKECYEACKNRSLELNKGK